MYKDQDKQREANRQANKRYRQGITQKVSREQGITLEQNDDGSFTVPEKLGPLKPERTPGGHIRVSKPGDADYVPQCETTRAFIEDRPRQQDYMRNGPGSKRGKDIKTFEDLPPDVQVIINSMSTNDGKVDQKNKADRTEAAIHYAHMFPDRFYNTGVT